MEEKGDPHGQEVYRTGIIGETEINRLDLAVWAREAVTDIQEADLARRCPRRQIPDFSDAAIGDDLFSLPELRLRRDSYPSALATRARAGAGDGRLH
jgi:hypothetical protein